MLCDDDLVQSCSILFTYCCTSESFACGLHDQRKFGCETSELRTFKNAQSNRFVK